MARQVNTKFVIALGAVLGVVGIGGGAYVGWNIMRNRNPQYLMAQAEAMEKRGESSKAYSLYHRAAERAVATHMEGAEDLCMKTAAMALKLSEEQADRDAAQQLYRDARATWQQALQMDSHYLPARERILEDEYEYVLASPNAADWTTIQGNADKLIEMAPTYANAYLYRADARLQLLRMGGAGGADITDTLTKIQKDLQETVKLAPDDGRAVATLAQVKFGQAKLAADRSLPKEADRLKEEGTALLQKFLAKKPNDANTSIALYAILQSKDPQAALKLLEGAHAANPNNVDLVNKLAEVYKRNDGVKAEKIIKDFLAANPGVNEEYIFLAQTYQQLGKLPEAIAAYKEVLDRSKSGGGVAAYKNARNQLIALYSISSLYMDLAEKEGAATTEGKADLAQASTFADRFRTGGAPAGMQSLLDGRLQLLRQNISQALVSLKRADANLGGVNPLPGQEKTWTEAKTLLTRAYIIQQQWGLAREQLDAIRLHPPEPALLELQRAIVLNHVGAYSEALAATKNVLAIPQLPASIKNEALRTQATALFNSGNREEADKIAASIDSVDGTLSLARMLLAQEKYDESLDALNRVLEKDPTNQMGLSLAIMANVRLERTDVARKLVEQGLAKYPNSSAFQIAKGTLSQPHANTVEAQLAVIKSITDDYTRAMLFVQFYQKNGDLTKEMLALQDAEKSLGESSSNAMADVIQRSFDTSLAQADAAQDPADKQRYWKVARGYIEKAQRLNLDGTGGSLLQGQLLFNQGDKNGGIVVLEQALAEHPDYSQAHTILGIMYLNEEKNDSALDQFRQAIKEKPDDVRALKGAIHLLGQKADPGSLEEARNDLKQALLFAPRDTQVMSFADILGDPASAIDVREQIYKKDPSNLQNIEHLAMLYVQNKQANKAVELIRPVYDKNPDNLGLADTLARLYRETQQINEARTVYERFLASSDPKVRFEGTLLLGTLNNSLGQTDEAIATFKAAVQLAPAGDDRAERYLADLYFDTDNMKDAESLYQKIYDEGRTKDMTVLRRIVETLIRQNKYAPADDLLQNTIFKQNPNDLEGLVLRGFEQMQQEKTQEALTTFNSVLVKDPTNTDALYHRALVQYTLQGDLDQAIKDLMIVRDRTPNSINGRLLLARVYRVSHRVSEAAAEYRNVINLRPDFITARREYAYFLMELAKVQQQLLPDNQDDIAYMIRSVKPMETLQAFLDDSATHFPNDSAWQIMQGDLQMLAGRQADAQKLYGQAFNASNGSPQAAAAYMDSLLRTRNYEDVIDLVTKIGTVRPNNTDDFVKRAAAYAAVGKMDEAIADFGRALDSGEHNLYLATVIAEQMLITLTPEKAISVIQARLAANPSSRATRLTLGQALLAADRATEAVQTLSPMKHDPNAQDKATILRILAMAEYQAKDLDGATADYQELLKIAPDDIKALNNLAFLLAEDLKRPKDALPYAARASKVLHTGEGSIALVNNGNVYDTLGWVELLAGDSDNGIRNLRRAIQSDPSTIAYYHLGKAYQKTGNKEEAGKAVQEGLKLAKGRKDPVESQLLVLQAELGK